MGRDTGSHARLYPLGDGLALESSFDSALVEAIKKLPARERRWDSDNRVWVVAPHHGPYVAQVVMDTLRVQIQVPQVKAGALPPLETRTVDLEYLARCRVREGDNQATAMGRIGGYWTYMFPEKILRAFFDSLTGSVSSIKPPTLFEVLVVTQDANEDAVKAAYKKQVKRWHPDVNKEPDAEDQFKRVKDAYDVLKDSNLRKRYLAGLKLERMAEQQMIEEKIYPDRVSANTFLNSSRATGRGMPNKFTQDQNDQYGYRTPWTCGHLVVEGRQTLNPFVVREIKSWVDIIDAQGRTMVASWPKGGDTFQVSWV